MFIPAYYINLNRSSARRKYIESMALALAVPITRVEAVDGSLLTDEQLNAVHPAHPNERRMTKSEVACFLSHRKVWLQISKNDNRYGAVFEDDIYMSKRLTALLAEDSWIHDDMDVVKLDKATKDSIKLGPPATIFEDLEIRKLKTLHMGCGGYILSKQSAKYLLSKTNKIHGPVDHAVFDDAYSASLQLSVYQINPAVCVHHQFHKRNFLPSDAENSILDDERASSQRNHSQYRRKKKLGIRKVWRELKRPIVKASLWTWRKLLNLISGDKWMKIDFRE